MIDVDLRNNLLRTSPMSEDEVQQFLIKCATDEIGKRVAERLHEWIDPSDQRKHFNDVSISTWAKWLKGKCQLQAFAQFNWNEKKNEYVCFLTYTEFFHQQNILIPDEIVQVQGSDIKDQQIVSYKGNIYLCEGEELTDIYNRGNFFKIKKNDTYGKIDAYHTYSPELSKQIVIDMLKIQDEND